MPDKNKDKLLAKVKKGLKHVESSDGTQMENPNSSATGFYGQLFNAKELKNVPYLQGVDRQSFAADTVLQNKLFEDRYYNRIPKVPGLQRNAIELRTEYEKQLKDKGSDFPYTNDEISALSNLLGREGTRKYFGNVLRDGKSLAEVFPKLYSEEALKETPNKTPEDYLKVYREGRDAYMYGGEVKKYNDGGPVTPIATSSNPLSNFFSSTDDPVGSYSDTEGNTFDMGDMPEETPLMSGFSAAGVADTAISVGSNILEAKELKKQFNKDLDDSQAVDKKAIKKLANDQRTAQGEAIGETAGTAIGAFFGAPGLGGKAGKFIGKTVSKIKGKKFKNKVEAKIDKEVGEHIDYTQGQTRVQDMQAQKNQEASNISSYISELTKPNQMLYAELGGMLYGNSHAKGGIILEAEGGEFITKKSAMKDNSVKTITGTNKQIVSKINAMADGKNPFPGAKMKNIYG